LKGVYFFFIIGLIASVPVTGIIVRLMGYHSGESVVGPFLCSVVGLVLTGAFIGHKLDKRYPEKFGQIRPWIYWPTIGVLAGFFTKSADASAFGVWVGLGVAIGGIMWWRRRKSEPKRSA
jgi:hypothetical protein